MVLQCKTQFLIYTGKITKMVHPDCFSEDGGRNSHRSDSEN